MIFIPCNAFHFLKELFFSSNVFRFSKDTFKHNNIYFPFQSSSDFQVSTGNSLVYLTHKNVYFCSAISNKHILIGVLATAHLIIDVPLSFKAKETTGALLFWQRNIGVSEPPKSVCRLAMKDMCIS